MTMTRELRYGALFMASYAMPPVMAPDGDREKRGGVGRSRAGVGVEGCKRATAGSGGGGGGGGPSPMMATAWRCRDRPRCSKATAMPSAAEIDVVECP